MGRRNLAVLLAAFMVVASLAGVAVAGKKKRVERAESLEYIGATGPRGAADTPCAGEPIGCVAFELKPTDRFVSIEVEDSAGEPVWVSVYVNGYTDGSNPHEHVCGVSDFAIPITKGLEELYVVTTQTTGGATSECTGPTTTGTITATFSNLP